MTREQSIQPKSANCRPSTTEKAQKFAALRSQRASEQWRAYLLAQDSDRYTVLKAPITYCHLSERVETPYYGQDWHTGICTCPDQDRLSILNDQLAREGWPNGTTPVRCKHFGIAAYCRMAALTQVAPCAVDMEEIEEPKARATGGGSSRWYDAERSVTLTNEEWATINDALDQYAAGLWAGAEESRWPKDQKALAIQTETIMRKIGVK